MKYRVISVGIMLPFLFLWDGHAHPNDFSVLKGPYLGQKPPGITPEVFALGIISVDSGLHSTPVFSPDGKMVFWTKLSGELFYMEEKEYWSEPRPAWFLRKRTMVSERLRFLATGSRG